MNESVTTYWTQIVAWLQIHAPAALAQIQGPATAAELDAVAAQLGMALPEDLREFYQLVNGAEDSGLFPAAGGWELMAFSPLSLAQLTQEWTMLKELLEMGDFRGRYAQSDAEIAPDWWNTAWLPFAGNGGGDYYCIDLAPTANGFIGQVISHDHESGKHQWLAFTLSSYLANLAESLAAGLLIYDEDYGLRWVEA